MRIRWRSATFSSLIFSVALWTDVHISTSAQAVHPVAADRVLTVCDVLENPSQYRHRILTVRGIYFDGLRQDCQRHLITGGHAWPDAVNLINAVPPLAGEGEPVGQTDLASWERLDRLVVREARANRKEEIWAEVTGLLRTPEKYVEADGRVALGFGHLGVYAAELVVIRISNVSVVHRPTYDYSLMLHASPK